MKRKTNAAIPKADWKWFGSAGHLIVGYACRFHLCTQVGQYLVSTVGEYWPEETVRRIHAQIHNPEWLKENIHLKGDAFDRAYMKQFGFEEIGYNRKYETMVFKAGEPCKAKGCNCGMPQVTDWSELAFNSYNNQGEATRGHMKMCEKYARIGDERAA